jgi:hypothetical protein
MPTRSGYEYLLARQSVPSIDRNMSGFENDPIGPRTVLVMYEVGQTQFSKLLLQDIYNVESQIMERDAYGMIIGPMALLSNQMMIGQNNAK